MGSIRLHFFGACWYTQILGGTPPLVTSSNPLLRVVPTLIRPPQPFGAPPLHSLPLHHLLKDQNTAGGWRELILHSHMDREYAKHCDVSGQQHAAQARPQRPGPASLGPRPESKGLVGCQQSGQEHGGPCHQSQGQLSEAEDQ